MGSLGEHKRIGRPTLVRAKRGLDVQPLVLFIFLGAADVAAKKLGGAIGI